MRARAYHCRTLRQSLSLLISSASCLRKALLLLVASFPCFGQDVIPLQSPDIANLTGLTTPIEVEFSDGTLVQGSGFFYFEFGPDEKKEQGPHWRALAHIYVVTAKHVIHPARLKKIVTFNYALRQSNNDRVEWYRLQLNSAELGSRLHLCRNESVDIAAVEVTDKLNAETKKALSERAKILNFNGASAENFPGNSMVQVQPGDDIVVIGYPLGIFDTFNKLPTLKTGLLNTPIGLRFNGLDAFLIDFKYYQGSSGSLIISKPTRLGFDKSGRLQLANSPQFAFLGVYQGEEVWNDVAPEAADLGLGWYYYNVEEAIKNPPFLP